VKEDTAPAKKGLAKKIEVVDTGKTLVEADKDEKPAKSEKKKEKPKQEPEPRPEKAWF
jgi:hypothetical protein